MGRPKKDPTGAELKSTHLKFRGRIKSVGVAKARAHGMSFTDYVERLIEADNPDLLDTNGIQEVLPQSA
ncbi:hypothetical protein KXR83_26425 [Williamsia muralis]|uniref:hypothetical protein n=1 Tax=Williamsia marianensis TaxID=85044 RepID=UPI003F180379